MDIVTYALCKNMTGQGVVDKVNELKDIVEEIDTKVVRTDNTQQHQEIQIPTMEDLAQVSNKMVNQGTEIGKLKEDYLVLESGKQDKLTAGQNIIIKNNVISATGGGGGGSETVEVIENLWSNSGVSVMNGTMVEDNGVIKAVFNHATSYVRLQKNLQLIQTAGKKIYARFKMLVVSNTPQGVQTAVFRFNGADGLKNIVYTKGYSHNAWNTIDGIYQLVGSSSATNPLFQFNFSIRQQDNFTVYLKDIFVSDHYQGDNAIEMYRAFVSANGDFGYPVPALGPEATTHRVLTSYLEKTDVIDDVTVTVGEGGDYPTLTSAIEFLSMFYPRYKSGGVKLVAQIKRGTVIGEQIYVVQQDLQYITITAEDDVVMINAANFTVTADAHDSRGDLWFIAGENAAKCPTIGCLFRLDKSTVPSGKQIGGLLCNRGSEGVVLANCGFQDFYDGVVANNESSITIRNGISRHMTRWGMHARHNGEVSGRSCDVSYCGIGAYADRVADLDAREAIFDRCTVAIDCQNLSRVNANGSGETSSGSEGSCDSCGDGASEVVIAVNGGQVNACMFSCTNGKADLFNVKNGGIIYANGAVTTGLASGKNVYTVGTNTLTGRGIIFT